MFNTNNGMFGNSPFSVENLQRLQLMQLYNLVNNYQIVNQDKYVEIQNMINNLSGDEKNFLIRNEDFINANTAYEQSVLNFVLNLFRSQFNQSPEGVKLLNNLELTASQAIKGVKDIVEKERSELRELSELVKQNPELLSMLKGKQASEK